MQRMILCGDAEIRLRELRSESVQTCITSPPYYGLRDYGITGQIGAENTPEEYINKLVDVFREVRRVLRPDGTLWVNIGDTYATGTKAKRQQSKNPGVGSNRQEAQNSVGRVGTPKGCKTKDLIGIPWTLAFALRKDGWYLRQDIIWHKQNAMPESVKDRCTKSHEYIFLLSKSDRYYFDAAAISEQAAEKSATSRRNKRDVWTINTGGFRGAHFAVFPEKLVEPCILAGCPEGGTVLDPFTGSGTTGVVAKQTGRNFIGIEINPEYCEMAERRIEGTQQRCEQMTIAFAQGTRI